MVVVDRVSIHRFHKQGLIVETRHFQRGSYWTLKIPKRALYTLVSYFRVIITVCRHSINFLTFGIFMEEGIFLISHEYSFEKSSV